MKNKLIYKEPQMEIIFFFAEDIITTSGGPGFCGELDDLTVEEEGEGEGE